jgi:hypothetical protein
MSKTLSILFSALEVEIDFFFIVIIDFSVKAIFDFREF